MRDVAIGYYAHHHGQGHITRARTIAAQLPCPMTLFSSSRTPANLPGSVTMCQLASDIAPLAPNATDEIPRLPAVLDDRGADQSPHTHPGVVPQALPHALPDVLHYAPLAMQGIVERMAVLVDWFRDAWPCLLVVDVSVEVALLARLCSVPTVYIRQRGNRSDPPHALAYASAVALLAPYPERFADHPVLDAWTEKTVFTGFIGRYQRQGKAEQKNTQTDRQNARMMPTRDGVIPFEQKSVTVLIGHGGTAINAEALCDAARSCPFWQWTIIGPISPPSGFAVPANIVFLGVLPDPARWIATANVVIGSAGDSVVAEIAAFRQRFICFAETRPFDEQMATAQSLERHALAVYCRHWPSAALWPVILNRAMSLDPARWDRFNEADGASRAAHAIMRAATDAWPHSTSGRFPC